MNKIKQNFYNLQIVKWFQKNSLITILNKARSLKQKLSHDNLFDIVVCVGLNK